MAHTFLLILLMGQAPRADNLALAVGSHETVVGAKEVVVPLQVLNVPEPWLNTLWLGGIQWDPAVLEFKEFLPPPEILRLEELSGAWLRPTIQILPAEGKMGIDNQNAVPEFFPFRVRYPLDEHRTATICHLRFRVLRPTTTAVTWMPITPQSVEPWPWTGVWMGEWFYFRPDIDHRPLIPGRITFSQPFRRGDLRGRGHVTVEDVRDLLWFLFLRGRAIDCLDAADVNDDGRVNVTDAIFALNFLFRSGPAPPPPFGDPGGDPTPDGLGCPSTAQ